MLSLLSILPILLCAPSLAAPASKRAAPEFVFEGDAPFSVDIDTLVNSLTCPYGSPNEQSPPVLLVHGTAVTGQETWGEGYVPALKKAGYTACYVTLPGRAMGDMQISSEYVAYNIHYLSQLSGGLQPAIVAHSQGNPVTQWALQFWPSTRNVARAFISLSPDFHGIELFNSPLSDLCEGNSLCQASLWQQSLGSEYYKALHNQDFRALVPTTTIWTETDGVVIPPGDNGQLPGAKVIRLQDMCKLRPTLHITITIDGPTYDLALDALNHDGIADIGRVKNFWTCLQLFGDGMDINVLDQIEGGFNAVAKGFIGSPGRISSEPPVAEYALPNGSA